MRKSKSAYMNYVCPYCWNALNKCTCDLFPPYHLIFIDKDIQEHIRILNEKGYKTTACCEGHMRTCLITYIAFPNHYFNNVNMPDGFIYDSKRKIIKCNYPTKITKENFEELKKANLEILLEWCNSLPNRND